MTSAKLLQSHIELPLPSATPYAPLRWLPRSRRARFLIFLGVLSLMVDGLQGGYFWSGRHRLHIGGFSQPEGHTSSTKTSEPKPIVVLPATRTSPSFCRTLFSLLVNGYDPPVIINWEAQKDQQSIIEVATGVLPKEVDANKRKQRDAIKRSTFNHYNKIEGMLSWLEARQGNASDIVMMVDAHDVWAQLPASFTHAQYASYPFRSHPGVLVGAEKNCYPFSRKDPHCRDLPESPLPRDVYGDETDKLHAKAPSNRYPAISQNVKYEYGKLETVRPRYLNSGTVIGSSGELKDLFSKMAEKLKLVESGRLIPRVRGSDQELMTRVNLDSIRKEGHQAVLGDDHLMLFQVVTFSYKDLIFQSLGETIRDGRGLQRTLLQGIVEENADWEPRRIAFNHISETVPSLLHFPGPKKPEFWWDYMWWMQPITIVDFFGRPKENITPAQVFYKKMKSHTDEASGYGAKLPDDSWLSYMDLCEPFVEDILK